MPHTPTIIASGGWKEPDFAYLSHFTHGFFILQLVYFFLVRRSQLQAALFRALSA